MHQTFQKELFRFRIKTAREFLKSLQNVSTPISTNPNEPLKLNAQVQGMGPVFKLTLKVQNISSSSPSINLFITFIYDEKLYKISNGLVEVYLHTFYFTCSLYLLYILLKKFFMFSCLCLFLA
jgi:Bardet-Biedl syndrome 1 protein